MGIATQGTHLEKIARALESGAAAHSALIASWQRSYRLHGLDPASKRTPQRISAGELAAAREAIGELVQVAQPNLDRLFQAVGTVGCAVLLANRDGIPVERRGAAGDDNTFRDWGLWVGTRWDEGAEGTNGIGTCLTENRAVVIHRDQHFMARNTALSCMSAPIYDENGALAAALDVSSCRADLTGGFATLIANAVIDAARSIEAENFRRAFAGARTRILVVETGGRLGLSLLAVDQDDLVIGATRAARQAFALTGQRLAHQVPAPDLLGQAEGDRLETGERAILHRAMARAKGNVSEAARMLGISRATLHRKINRLSLQAIR